MNLNPIDFNYIDGENIYPIQEYINEQISTLSISGITTSNVIINSNQKLNDILYYSNAVVFTNQTKNLYLANNYNWGGIIFKTYFNYPQSGDTGVKIDYTGRLFVYHNFNALQPLFGAGYYDVEGEILGLKNDGIATDIQLTVIEGTITTIIGDITAIEGELNNVAGALTFLQEEIDIIATNLQLDSQEFINNYNTANEAITAFGNFLRRDRNVIANRVDASLSWGLGGAVVAGIGAIGGYIYNQQMSNLAYKASPINFTFSSNDRTTLLNLASNQDKYFTSNYKVATSNLGIESGFINSNIITSQFIPSLNTNAITYQGVEISNTLNNYLLKAGGTMTGRVNFNYGTNVFGNPVAGGGGNGERLNLNINGITGSDFPPSIGVSSNSLWNSVPNNHRFQWFNNGNQIMSLSSNGILNVPSILENNLTLSNISQTTILNSTPNVQKKYMFTGTCSSSILMPDGITYYAYDIDVRNYTQLKYAPNPNTPYRIFNIKVFFGSVYFGFLTNGRPNVLSYEVYMSNESQAGGGGIGSAGLNVCAIGYPENVILNTISPTQLSLVCGDFNFITVLSRVNGTVFNAVIEDVLF
jgi:hypothetical protein